MSEGIGSISFQGPVNIALREFHGKCEMVMKILPVSLLLLLALSSSRLPAAVVDVVLIAGQSNASGRGSVNALPASPLDAGIEYYFDNVDRFSTNGEFISLRSFNGNKFGFEMTLGRKLTELGVENLAIIKGSQGGTSLSSTDDWKPGGGAHLTV